MQRILLKSKIHRAAVTGADINYEGSIAIDPAICKEADINEYERVDIYNINNGNRFSTYVIYGREKDFVLNGAAARLVQPGDLIIIASYSNYSENEVATHRPTIVIMGRDNGIKEIKR
jgi:aspartate 1-decarboxylase